MGDLGESQAAVGLKPPVAFEDKFDASQSENHIKEAACPHARFIKALVSHYFKHQNTGCLLSHH